VPGVNDADAYRDAMARHANGVAVVSTAGEDGFRGLTASSVASVSLSPPLLLVCIDSATITRDVIAATGKFNVNFLAREQEFLADRFSGRAPLVDPRWREVPHRLGDNGLPLIGGCVAWVECSLEQLHEGGDHEIAVGRVTAAAAGAGDPLVYWDRSFWTLSR
jgi:flavin reductase (DIM6/NTAB) family NADH-FMN oxidoreductase RutF